MGTLTEITLANLAGGALMECATIELRKICENIADPNCKADAKRKLSITVLIEPDKKRSTAEVTYEVKSSMPGPDSGKTVAYLARTQDGPGLSLFEMEGHQSLFEQEAEVKPLARARAYTPPVPPSQPPSQGTPMDITAETIQEIVELAKTEIVQVCDFHGQEAPFSTKPVHQVKVAPPDIPATIKVTTLAGFADLVKANIESAKFREDYLIHVEDHLSVILKARVSDEYGRRQVLVTASPVPFASFKFGQWMDQETFVISIASLFADTEDKGYILNLASTLTNEATRTSDDNGFTQKATAKAGLRHKEEVTLKPRVVLAPFRTFPEIDQPASEFVFRAKCDGEGQPYLMLVEADGGKWKIAAMETLRKAMEAFGLEIPVIS